MSDDNPAARANPPRWMPIGEEPELCSAGEWWDAVRAVEDVGRRAIANASLHRTPIGDRRSPAPTPLSRNPRPATEAAHRCAA